MKPYTGNDEDHFDIGFEQFKLRPGMELEVHDSAGRPLEHRAQFVMAFPGKGVLISFRVNDADKIGMKAGERYRISGFNGKFDFSFTSAVQKVDRSQFTAVLDAPATVAVHFVRRHQRTTLALPAAVTMAGKDTIPVTIRNLSLGGAGIDSIKPLGAVGDTVNLLIQITFDNQREILNLVSVIRRSAESEDSLMYSSGVEFTSAGRNDKLLLHYYITTVAYEFNLV